MDAIAFAQFMYKVLKQRQDEIADALAHDVAKDFHEYKLLVGEIRGLSYAREELKALLENADEDVEDFISS
jgi:hypothetical protein